VPQLVELFAAKSLAVEVVAAEILVVVNQAVLLAELLEDELLRAAQMELLKT